jgi:hypothetical protein
MDPNSASRKIFIVFVFAVAAVSSLSLPRSGATWQWQLSGDLVDTFDVDVYDIDLHDNSVGDIASLHDDGRYVICYFSAGSHEDWRPDVDSIPRSALGNDLDGWPGERWFDIRSDAVSKLMRDRIDLASSKGCDAIEPDNTDGFLADTGFPLSRSNYISYFKMMADHAHSLDVAIALKNSVEIATDVFDHADFAINEECLQWHECDMLDQFVMNHKAVFHCEYNRSFDPCDGPDGFSSIRKSLDLEALPLEFCERAPDPEPEMVLEDEADDQELEMDNEDVCHHLSCEPQLMIVPCGEYTCIAVSSRSVN